MTNYRNSSLYDRRRSARRRAQQSSRRPHRLAFCLFLCACALLCKFCWPQGIAAVKDLLVGSEGGRVQRGVNAAAEAIREREPLGEVAEAFWLGLQSEAPA